MHIAACNHISLFLKVLGTRWGTCADYYCVPEQLVSLAPKNIPLWQAAGLPLVSLTVIQV